MDSDRWDRGGLRYVGRDKYAARLLSDLSDGDVRVLSVVAEAPSIQGAERVAELPKYRSITEEAGRSKGTLNLGEAIPEMPSDALRMACANLVARGLLKDWGVGRLGTTAMEFFVATPSARWFLDWIKG